MTVEQIGRDLVFVAYFTEGGQGKAGLSPTINVAKADGTLIADTQAMSEVHATKLAGLYLYTLDGDDNDEASNYLAKASVGSGADVLEVPVGILVGTQWVERLDAAVSAAVTAAAAAASSASSAATSAAAAATAAAGAATPGAQMTLPDGHLTDAKFGADMDTYTAEIWLVDDDSGATDLYVVKWFKNGQPINTGITTPTIQVVKVADGTDLVAETAMTAIGSTGALKYSEATNRIGDGAGYLVIAKASIDSATREACQPMSRDSEEEA